MLHHSRQQHDESAVFDVIELAHIDQRFGQTYVYIGSVV